MELARRKGLVKVVSEAETIHAERKVEICDGYGFPSDYLRFRGCGQVSVVGLAGCGLGWCGLYVIHNVSPFFQCIGAYFAPVVFRLAIALCTAI